MALTGFILHLERATARAEQVRQLQTQHPCDWTILKAVDGSTLTENEVQSIYRPSLLRPHYPFRLRPSEIGCFLSHRTAWREIVAQDLEFALIVEDDIALDPDVFPTALELGLAGLKDFGWIRFPWFDQETPSTVMQTRGASRLYRPKQTGLGMLAQLVSNSAARTLLKSTETFDRPVDTFLQMDWITKVPCLSVFPSGVREISAELGGSTIGRKLPFGAKLHREIMRPIYRSQIALYSHFRHGAK